MAAAAAAAQLRGMGFPVGGGGGGAAAEWVATAAAAASGGGGGCDDDALAAAALDADFGAGGGADGADGAVGGGHGADAGNNMLPAGVSGMLQGVLSVRVVLQVDEVVDIGAAARERYVGCDGGATGGAPTPARASRVLKLRLTDGAQRVTAVEYK